PTTTVIEPATGGRNTLIVRLRAASGETFYARAWRYDRLVRPAREQLEVARRFTDAGLDVPEIMLIDDSLATLRRWRLEAAVEREAPGRPLSELLEKSGGELAPDHMSRVATAFARMHRFTDSNWGCPWRPMNTMGDLRRYLLDRLPRLQ